MEEQVEGRTYCSPKRAPALTSAWVIAFACFWVNVFIMAIFRSAGVLYMALVRTYGCSYAQASWPITLAGGVASIAGLPAGFLSHFVSKRTIVSLGVIISSSGVALCFFADSISRVVLFLGVVQGLGIGLVTVLLPAIISDYFGRQRAAACGLSYAGATAGAFIFPIFIEWQVNHFGLRGSFLLMGGITLNGLIGALLLRPIEGYQRYAEQSVRATRPFLAQQISKIHGDTKAVFEPTRPLIDGHPTRVHLITSDTNSHGNPSHGAQGWASFGKQLKLKLQQERDARDAEPSEDEERGGGGGHGRDARKGREGGEKRRPAASSRKSPISIHETDTEKLAVSGFFTRRGEGRAVEGGKRPWGGGGRSCQEKNITLGLTIKDHLKKDLRLLTQPYFALITLTYVVYIVNYVTLLIILPDFAMDRGIDKARAILTLSLFAVTDLVGRLLPGWLSYAGLFSNKTMFIGSITALGALFVTIPWMAWSYSTILAFTLSLGLVSGCQMVLPPVILSEYLGSGNTAVAFGLSNFICGLLAFLRPLLIGYIKDRTNQYDHVFYILGSFALMSSFFWFLEIIFVRIKRVKI